MGAPALRTRLKSCKCTFSPSFPSPTHSFLLTILPPSHNYPPEIARLPLIERKELFNAIFDISTYRPPANIQLPEGYQPPTLTISKLYWKGWILLLVLSAYNPKTIGLMGWKEYPMLCSMMEMVMTNTYTFPTSVSLGVCEDGTKENKDAVVLREVQIARSEKEAILEYENHLASSSSQSATITEANSFLLNQLTLLQPK